MNSIEPIWELAGMSRSEYAKKSWGQKKVLLRRFKGVGIGLACNECGMRLSDAREWDAIKALPDNLQRHPFGLLISAYSQEKGMRVAMGAEKQKTDAGDWIKF